MMMMMMMMTTMIMTKMTDIFAKTVMDGICVDHNGGQCRCPWLILR